MIPTRRLHRGAGAGAVLAAFLLVHVANHLVALAGVDAHVRFMETARLVYRQPVVESLLLLCVAVQAGSGLALAWAGRRRRGVLARGQVASGGYLALFLAIHVAAVLAGRVAGLDTNFHFAAAGLHVWPFVLFFGPYYFFAVAALCVHVGCALAWRVRTRLVAVAGAAAVAGVVLGAVIVACLLGVVQPVAVPPAYLATFQ